MKRAKLTDLDPATRRRLLDGKGERRPRAPRAAPQASGLERLGRDTNRYRCGTCGRIDRGYTAAERHTLGEHQGGRISLILPDDARGD